MLKPMSHASTTSTHHHQAIHSNNTYTPDPFTNYQHLDQFGSINQAPPPLSSEIFETITTTDRTTPSNTTTTTLNTHNNQNNNNNPTGNWHGPNTNTSNTAKQPLNIQPQSTYQSFADIADPVQNPHLFIHVASGQKISRPWQAYISDLDDFFERIYNYYRKSGFICIVVENILELLEILLVVLLTFFFVNCVDYDVLFKRKFPPGHSGSHTQPDDKTPFKITITDCLIPFTSIRFTSLEIVLLVFAATFWFIKLGIAVYSIVSNYAIRSFFIEALQIHDPSLYSWQEVQVRLIHAQSHCLLRESHLDELAIHNRLLRRANYMIALVNKGVLPIYYRLPLIGECIYLTSGLEFNLNILLFKGVFSLFDKNWKLRDEIKSPAERIESARRFSNRCVALALLNTVLLPMIVIWQWLYAFYTYVEAVKRDPTMFSSRTWSRYGRWFCRHFNELDHELDQRLNRAHRPATRYMNSFTAPLLEIIARFITFISGILLSVLIVLTVYDEDVITVEHVLTLITGLGATIAISRAFLPDSEPNRWNFQELDAAILQHIHYRPHNHPAHTIQARNAMSNIFVYKSTTIIEELISPLLIPYILVRHLRSRSLEIVDFFRVYTLELADIGDVCTFSQLNFHQNGHRIFNQQQAPCQPEMTKPATETSTASSGTKKLIKPIPAVPEVLPDEQNTTRNGKLELSLINFKLKNPQWQPNDNSQTEFIDQFTRQSRQAMVGSNIDNQGDLRESMSNSAMGRMMQDNVQHHKQQKKNVQFELNPSQQQQMMNDSSMVLDRDLNHGFAEQRRRLMQLRYRSIFSDQEERDQEMSISTLYFHQMVTDSLQQHSINATTNNDHQLHQTGSCFGGGGQEYGLSASSSHHGHLQFNESIPLLQKKDSTSKFNKHHHEQFYDDDDDDDD